jgi:uncharacterized protein YbaP (TraB family)
MTDLRRLAVRLVLALAVLFVGAGAALAEPALWVVRSPTAKVVLFGSVHILPPGLVWEPPALKTALDEANEVWFEIPVDHAADLAVAQAALDSGLQPTGHSLAGDLSARDRARLIQAALACGLAADNLNRLKPWLAEVYLTVESYRLAGAAPDDGVERRLAAQIGPNVQRRAFETPEQQIGYLSAAPLRDQVASLRQTLREIVEGPKAYQRVVDAWMAGDPAALRREALTPMIKAAPRVYKTLVVDRNRRWADILTQRLKGSGEAVVVVGVGHLIGPDSLPALLRARGFDVEGPRGE